MRTRRRSVKPSPRRAARKKPRSKPGRVALVGVGSPLRGDDGAGVAAALKVAASLKRSSSARMRAFDGGTAPENLAGEIIRFLKGGKGAGSHVILLDAADMKLKPGEVRTLSLESLSEFSLSTHRLPLSLLVNYLVQNAGCGVTVIGIQPGNTEYREGLSRNVASAARRLARMLRDGSWEKIPVLKGTL